MHKWANSARVGKVAAMWIVIYAALLACAASAFAADTRCAAMSGLVLPQVTILSTEQRNAGDFEPPSEGRSTSQKPNAENVPAFCRVIGMATPTPDSRIRFEVWLPDSAVWNGKLEGVGNHAFLGSISYDAMAEGLRRGYATAGTDTGHISDDLKFAAGHPEKIVDWAYRSVHLTTELAKLIVRDYEGRLPVHSYFDGCDSGGQEALTEALRYPGDYDGVIAGNPPADRLHEVIGYLGVWEATHDSDDKPLLSLTSLRLLTKSALLACDKLDGVEDGVIENPAACHFDPGTLLCKDAPGESCLTSAQVAAARKVYAGVHNPRTGQLIFPGWPFGSEAFSDAPGQGWGSMVNGREPRRVDLLKSFVFDNPDWDWHTFDFDGDVTYADDKVGYISAASNDLSAFSKTGGKLLMYTGWADPILPATDVTESFDAKVKTAGGPQHAAEFMRLYMVPGMGHCGGGPGTTTFDMFPVLEQWVEQGNAPQRIIASRKLTDTSERTRPLCPYPQVAHWKGAGNTDDATNFACIAVPVAKPAPKSEPQQTTTKRPLP
jgi:feruloyl esterase